jgi:hypothetical protein
MKGYRLYQMDIQQDSAIVKGIKPYEIDGLAMSLPISLDSYQNKM